MFEIKIDTTEETEEFLKEFPKTFTQSLLKGVRRSLLFVEAKVKKRMNNRVRGPTRLGVVTGHLRRSIESGLKRSGNSIVANIHTNVVYAAIHEYGGIIRAKNKPYLVFKIKDKWIRKKQVTMPRRAFIRPVIKYNTRNIRNIILNSMVKDFEAMK